MGDELERTYLEQAYIVVLPLLVVRQSYMTISALSPQPSSFDLSHWGF